MGLTPGMAGYCEWRKVLFADDELRELAASARKVNGAGVDIRLVAVMIADAGRNGRGCFAESATIAAIYGCNRKTVDTLRAELIRRGWFVVVSRNGGTFRRSLVLDISLPGQVAQSRNGRPMTGRSPNGTGRSPNPGLGTTREYLPEKDVNELAKIGPARQDESSSSVDSSSSSSSMLERSDLADTPRSSFPPCPKCGQPADPWHSCPQSCVNCQRGQKCPWHHRGAA